MNLREIIVLSIITLFATSCSEINTNNPIETYKYWSGTNPTKDLEVINGKYWQSGHWTREYIMYLKLKPTENWWNDFIKENNLTIDKGAWTKSSDSPEWFNHSESTIIYKQEGDFDQGSRYLKDTITGECYIYEIQL